MEQSIATGDMTAATSSAVRREYLLTEIRKDPSISNNALPFWPPLFNLEQITEIATEMGGDGEGIQD
eukprot:321692-Rhodomonas_salina.1